MLTAELVRASRRGDKLVVSTLKGATKQRAVELAAIYLQLAREQVGDRYERLKEAWASVDVGPREKKLAGGLLKLIEDRCEFEAQSPVDPRQLRSEVFTLAAELRREHGAAFDRRQVFERLSVGTSHEPSTLEAAMFSDLRSQQVLLGVSAKDAADLVSAYELANYQAVLLRAVKVVAHVRCRDAAQYRALFRALKFRRLLYQIEAEPEGYRITIDGPFSMFESVTKYGLQLALIFPELRRCDELRLIARLRWGKQREALTLEYENKERNPESASVGPIVDEVNRLLEGLEKLDKGWRFSLNDQVLDLPGVGLCVPDVRCERGSERVFVEVMGFWSRDAVFKRVELVERGLSERVVFAASSRLRVSEAVLDDSASSALYVYKGVMSAKAVLERVEALAAARR